MNIPDNLLIREVEESDAGGIINHLNRIAGESDYHTFREGEYMLTVDEQVEKIKGIRKSCNSFMLIALVEDDIIGTLSLNGGNRSKTAHSAVVGISIRREFCGKHIGATMMQRAVEFSRFAGVSKINLMVHENNDRALRFYLRFGFRIEGKIAKYFSDDCGCHMGICMGMNV